MVEIKNPKTKKKVEGEGENAADFLRIVFYFILFQCHLFTIFESSLVHFVLFINHQKQ